MLIYYRFYHPSGPIKFSFMQEESPNQQPSEDFNTMTLRSLKQMRCEIKNNASPKSMTQSKKLLNTTTTLSDSVIVIEENDEDTDTDIDIKILQDWINDTAYECNSTSVEINSKPTNTASKDEECFKRRAICSAADLVKLIESKATETDFIVNSKLTRIEETPSEILSAHDYENLCAVNIARETWGLRSWKGYSDIENWLHDESVVNERLDTLTSTATSSDRSGSTFQKGNEAMKQYDFIDTVGNDSAQSESETNSNDIGQFSIESLTVTYPLGTLDPIFEEIEELSTSTDLSDVKIKESSVSTLVATIDKIRLNTPISNPYQA